jgi:hypothetical protein
VTERLTVDRLATGAAVEVRLLDDFRVGEGRKHEDAPCGAPSVVPRGFQPRAQPCPKWNVAPLIVMSVNMEDKSAPPEKPVVT